MPLGRESDTLAVVSARRRNDAGTFRVSTPQLIELDPSAADFEGDGRIAWLIFGVPFCARG